MARGKSGSQYKLSLIVTASTAPASWGAAQVSARGGRLLTGLFKVAKGVVGGIASGFRKAAKVVTGVFAFAIETATRLVKYLGIAAGAATAAIWGAITALSPAGSIEKYTIQLEVMLGTAEKAQQGLTYLRKFASTTPFQLPHFSPRPWG